MQFCPTAKIIHATQLAHKRTTWERTTGETNIKTLAKLHKSSSQHVAHKCEYREHAKLLCIKPSFILPTTAIGDGGLAMWCFKQWVGLQRWWATFIGSSQRTTFCCLQDLPNNVAIWLIHWWFHSGRSVSNSTLQNKGFDNSSATTKDIDDARWFGDCSVGYIGGLFCSWASQILYNLSSKTWRALPGTVSTCCRSATWHRLEPVFRTSWRRRHPSHLVGHWTSHGIQYFIHGADTLINNWNTMVSKCGQRNGDTLTFPLKVSQDHITFGEVIATTKTFKNRQATGRDNLPAEFSTTICVHESLTCQWAVCFGNKVWCSGHVPDDWHETGVSSDFPGTRPGFLRNLSPYLSIGNRLQVVCHNLTAQIECSRRWHENAIRLSNLSKLCCLGALLLKGFKSIWNKLVLQKMVHWHSGFWIDHKLVGPIPRMA